MSADRIFAFATNPLIGVIVGVLATSLVQSSSTVTSVIVGLVAGDLPVGHAVPMIMGANMGTTITNTIVSLASAGRGTEFERSFAAATVHDFLNLYSILIFLPLEIIYHPLERLAVFFVLPDLAVGGQMMFLGTEETIVEIVEGEQLDDLEREVQQGNLAVE